jgi:hypothetical protein
VDCSHHVPKCVLDFLGAFPNRRQRAEGSRRLLNVSRQQRRKYFDTLNMWKGSVNGSYTATVHIALLLRNNPWFFLFVFIHFGGGVDLKNE